MYFNRLFSFIEKHPILDITIIDKETKLVVHCY